MRNKISYGLRKCLLMGCLLYVREKNNYTVKNLNAHLDWVFKINITNEGQSKTRQTQNETPLFLNREEKA